MSWVKLSDDFPSHIKARRAGGPAVLLWLAGNCYAARHGTDGFLPAEDVPLLEWFAEGLPERLVAAGLWDVAAGGYWVHDFLLYNLSAAEREEQRKAWRDRQARKRVTDVSRRDNPGDSRVDHGVTREGEGDSSSLQEADPPRSAALISPAPPSVIDPAAREQAEESLYPQLTKPGVEPRIEYDPGTRPVQPIRGPAAGVGRGDHGNGHSGQPSTLRERGPPELRRPAGPSDYVRPAEPCGVEFCDGLHHWRRDPVEHRYEPSRPCPRR